MLSADIPDGEYGDVLDYFNQVLGSGVHNILENAGTTYIKELRTTIGVEGKVIKLLSGKIDLLDPGQGMLLDYKVGSVWMYKLGKLEKNEYVAQLNINAFIIETFYKIKVNKLKLIYFFRDWSLTEKRRDKEYPESSIISVDIIKWDPFYTIDYIKTRIAYHENTVNKYNQGLDVYCSEEERWHQPDKWAVIKTGNSKATRVFDKESEAKMFINSKFKDKDQYYIDFRKGGDTRCTDYCTLKNLCNYYRRTYEQNSGTNS